MPWQSTSWLAPASRDHTEQKCSLNVAPSCQYTSWSGSQKWPRGNNLLQTHLPKALVQYSTVFARMRLPVGSLCNHRKHACEACATTAKVTHASLAKCSTCKSRAHNLKTTQAGQDSIHEMVPSKSAASRSHNVLPKHQLTGVTKVASLAVPAGQDCNMQPQRFAKTPAGQAHNMSLPESQQDSACLGHLNLAEYGAQRAAFAITALEPKKLMAWQIMRWQASPARAQPHRARLPGSSYPEETRSSTQISTRFFHKMFEAREPMHGRCPTSIWANCPRKFCGRRHFLRVRGVTFI
jgi:hypothetical protein